MQKKNSAFKWIVIGLVAAIVVVGALFAVKNAGIKEAVDPTANQAQTQDFEVDPDNPPEGMQIIRDGASDSTANEQNTSK